MRDEGLLPPAAADAARALRDRLGVGGPDRRRAWDRADRGR
jgi:hypothetical protein